MSNMGRQPVAETFTAAHLGEGPHQRLVVLHTARRVDQNDIKPILLGYRPRSSRKSVACN